MKSTGTTISAVCHAAFLLWGLISFASKPYEVKDAEMPIDVISASDFSKLTAGVMTAPPTARPKPLVEKVAPPKPVEDVTAKVVETTEIKASTDAAPPPPDVKLPEPKPVEPKPPAAAEPKRVEAKAAEAKKAEPKAAEPKKAEPKAAEPKKAEPKAAEPKLAEPKRDLIAEALRKEEPKKAEAKKADPKVAEAAKADPKKAEAKAAEPKAADPKAAEPKAAEAKPSPKTAAQPKFDPRNVEALLNRRAPQRLAAAGDALNPVAGLGAPKGTATELSQNELDALRARLSQCWSPPAGAIDSGRLQVVLRVAFKQDGTVAKPPELLAAPMSQFGPAMVESAKRALLQCQPYNMLKVEHYELWKDMEILFDPLTMLRG